MLYVRGNKDDFDGWVTKYGATGWSYEEVLPYFKSIETFYVPKYANNGYHGHQGELPIGYAPSQSEASKAYLEGWRQLGYHSVDYNGPSQIGYSRPQVNNANGKRVSSSTAFILPIVKERPNLHITLRSFAKKIQFEGNRAVGVHFDKLGVPHFARARREVILSAGAIGSPQLLMLSGVGPKEHLEQFQIPVLADVPVGENLQDHIIIGGLAFTLEKNAGLHPEALSAYESYCSRGAGPYSVPMGVEALSFTKTSITNDARPDVEYYLFGISPAGAGSEQYNTVALGYTDKVYSKYYLPKRNEYAVQVAPGINGLKSRGVIKLGTTDPYDHPIIDPNYFSHPDDVLIAIEASKIALQVMQTDAMKSLGARPWDIPLPGCEDKVMYSDEYLECLARHLTHTEGHYAGTCAMGTHEGAVVDPRLRVRGVTHLRVIDASIMPEVTTGNTNAPAMMIAEKGSAMVLEDNGLAVCNAVVS
ncbi:glucose dehydrogenase [FAD, quinone]-like [Ornithodoros turicata]|uniref:glucose dehydrogenase [FAD, quinone]-like n=1 Tax=Ornithodoros turicata TaxID=34597 RepID=UPI003138CB1A